MKKYWFRTTNMGIGRPVSWEGWLSTISYGLWILYQLNTIFVIGRTQAAVPSASSLILKFVIPTVIIFIIMWYKTRPMSDKDINVPTDNFKNFISNRISKLLLGMVVILIMYFIFQLI